LKPGLRDVRSATTALVFMYEYSTKVWGKLFIFGLADHVFQIMILPVIEDTTKFRYYAITVKFATLKKIKTFRVWFSGMWRRVCGWIDITISEKYLASFFMVEILIGRRMYPAPSKRFYRKAQLHNPSNKLSKCLSSVKVFRIGKTVPIFNL
jgi:hypothetical protein